jgi:hypothetical protein
MQTATRDGALGVRRRGRTLRRFGAEATADLPPGANSREWVVRLTAYLLTVWAYRMGPGRGTGLRGSTHFQKSSSLVSPRRDHGSAELAAIRQGAGLAGGGMHSRSPPLPCRDAKARRTPFGRNRQARPWPGMFPMAPPTMSSASGRQILVGARARASLDEVTDILCTSGTTGQPKAAHRSGTSLPTRSDPAHGRLAQPGASGRRGS